MGVGGQKILKNFFQSTWKTESAKSISELYTDIKLNYFINPKNIFKSARKVYALHQGDNFQSCYYQIC